MTNVVDIIQELTNLRLQIGQLKLREKELFAMLEIKKDIPPETFKALPPVLRAHDGRVFKRTPEQRENMRLAQIKIWAEKRRKDQKA